MQIILNQAEIQQAVSDFINNTVQVQEGNTIVVSFKAVRGGDDCVQATIDILPEGSEVPFQVAEPEPEVTKPAPRKVQERKHVPVPEKKVEPEPEAAEEPAAKQEDAAEPETLQEEATKAAEAAEPEVASQEAAVEEKAQEAEVAEAPKKSLFAGLKR